ncbi:MAG: ISNCY family transposase [Pseudomonadota bacterium]|nr:ISNCY family transposase [Desulfobacterales bacterium]
MRKVIEKQLKIGQVDISKIQVDINCRDEIPQLLLGLQAIYSDRSLRGEIFDILKNIIPENVDTGNGRPGMDLWKILVLGTLRLNCNWDYDKLHNIANNHKDVREFLGHTIFEFDQTYALQTLKDNITLFTPEVLDEINQVVVKVGHNLIRENDDAPLKGRCDSFVVETDVHYPTDINLLLDAIRKVVFLIGRLCSELGITEWRQYRHIFKKIKKQFNTVRKLKRSASKDETKKAKRDQLIIGAHRQYVALVESYVARAKESIRIPNAMDIGNVACVMLIENYITHAERQIDQIRRRVLDGQTIPHNEKAFSIFEEHTEWISKGKAGVPQELGLAVCILEDQYGFILHHHVMENQNDVEIAILMVVEAKRKFAALYGCSFDKGFYSPKNKEELEDLLDEVVLPKKGKLSKKDKQTEHSEEFIESRRKHSAVESAINALENHALDRCPDHGIDGLKRYVALAVIARNIQLLGAMIREKELERQKRRRQAEKDKYAFAA